MNSLWDCLIIGGGPAGLTAGIYLARYRRKVILYDLFTSRAALIPISHNYPGFPQGISGANLLNNLRQQISLYKIPIIREAVDSIQQINKDLFLAKTTKEKIHAKNIILATGVKDIEPQLLDIKEGIQNGLIRHCPVCDAYEIINKKIAVIGLGTKGLEEAIFMLDYTPEVTLITLGTEDNWTKKELERIKYSKLNIITKPIEAIKLSCNSAEITFENQKFHFDSIYSALGSIKNNKLALDLALKEKNGCLIVDKHQQTSMKGVFAAGDIVSGLNQICVATGQGAIAATAVHTRCRK